MVTQMQGKLYTYKFSMKCGGERILNAWESSDEPTYFLCQVNRKGKKQVGGEIQHERLERDSLNRGSFLKKRIGSQKIGNFSFTVTLWLLLGLFIAETAAMAFP